MAQDVDHDNGQRSADERQRETVQPNERVLSPPRRVFQGLRLPSLHDDAAVQRPWCTCDEGRKELACTVLVALRQEPHDRRVRRHQGVRCDEQGRQRRVAHNACPEKLRRVQRGADEHQRGQPRGVHEDGRTVRHPRVAVGRWHVSERPS